MRNTKVGICAFMIDKTCCISITTLLYREGMRMLFLYRKTGKIWSYEKNNVSLHHIPKMRRI